MRTIFAILAFALCLSAQNGRDVTEFTLFKQKEPMMVGPIGLILKETDPNKQRFKVVLVINGRQIERRDQDALIPIFFYAAEGDQQPHELLITRVAKDQITGRVVSPVH
jgi:hypothetical protein